MHWKSFIAGAGVVWVWLFVRLMLAYRRGEVERIRAIDGSHYFSLRLPFGLSAFLMWLELRRGDGQARRKVKA